MEQCEHCSQPILALHYSRHVAACIKHRQIQERSSEALLRQIAMRSRLEARDAHMRALNPHLFLTTSANSLNSRNAETSSINNPAHSIPSIPTPILRPVSEEAPQGLDEFFTVDGSNDDDDEEYIPPLVDIEESDDESSDWEVEADDIRVETHPGANVPVRNYRFDEYTQRKRAGENDDDVSEGEPRKRMPWHPFPSRTDFDFAALLLETHMNAGQRSNLIHIFNRVKAPLALKPDGTPEDDTLTIESDQRLSEIWDAALRQYGATFLKRPMTLHIPDATYEYDVYFQPIIDWIKQLLLDKEIVKHFEWNAQRLYRYDGEAQRFVRIIHEPWTADAWWNFQSSIPEGGSPFCIIFYSDKTHLSSFGTAKGHPVLVRCANLPISIRNGTGVGGGRMIGWLPVPKEDTERAGSYRHLLGELKDVVTSSELNTRKASGEIDKGFQSIPRWRELEHFHTIFDSGEYKDGSKYESMSKARVHVIIFACAHVFTREATPWGYLLLQLLRSFIELDMLASMTLHDEFTLAEIETELKVFDGVLQKYKTVSTKKWDFPKIHTHKHLVRDIQLKGVTRNYNTKVSEKANGHYKKFYQNHTNFKEVDAQACLRVVIFAPLILIDSRYCISARKGEEDESDAEENADSDSDPSFASSDRSGDGPDDGFKRILYGAPSEQIIIKDLIPKHQDIAYHNLGEKVKNCLSTLVKENIANQPRVDFTSLEITTYRYMKVQYADVVDWNWKADILRANPKFHNHPRYDYALVQVEGNECYFVQLVCIFTVTFSNVTHQLALVVPFDAPRQRGLQVRRDRDLRLRLVRQQPRAKSIVISADCIIRGGLLAPDHISHLGDFFVVEFIDEDMWRRLKRVQLVQRRR
ncbi:hypothetical protein CVT24_000863 [Panaeolus cyanescens]|uniref:Uncharacterized protein n=1 Tax=Panaeolus cyanescens TaxID=181874 RepID=A0A409W776_9AGAR|nr:hypothetical protein CVT24_000863 [Panaeolus cyanescens]